MDVFERGRLHGIADAGSGGQAPDGLRVAEPESIDGSHLPWIPFSLQRLSDLTAQGRTVLVDFTADWCPNCKLNEAIALNTSATKTLVDKNRVACLLADWTNKAPEITRLLKKLGSISVPLTVIFPANRPNEPIPLRELYTQGMLLDALRDAGPSRSPVADATAGAPRGG